MQIVLLGSDGREYMFLAKPKDDLRKDNRMMEVATVINRLFAREPASRRRNLYLRRRALCTLCVCLLTGKISCMMDSEGGMAWASG